MAVATRHRWLQLSQLLILFFGFLSTGGCSAIGSPMGVMGHYRAGREALIKPRGIGADQAISYLEETAKRDPLYQDTLTLLGRAYYKKGRYRDAHAMLQRALAVKKDDEMAWIVLGLTQLRLGEDQRGLESLKGGITLLSKASNDGGYLGYRFWDARGMVRSRIRQAVFQVTKGLEEKENVIRSVESIISQIEDEEHLQRTEKQLEQIPEMN